MQIYSYLLNAVTFILYIIRLSSFIFVLILSVSNFRILYKLGDPFPLRGFYIFTILSMKNFPETQSKSDNTENVPSTLRERKKPSFQNITQVNFVEDRLFYLKTQEIIDELTQIMVFIKELEKF